jgi:hypothetical protein
MGSEEDKYLSKSVKTSFCLLLHHNVITFIS